VFAFFALLSLHTRVYGNWPAAGYLTASLLVAAFFSPDASDRPSRVRAWGRSLWPWALGTAYLMTALLLLQVVYPLLPIPPRLDRISRETTGWRALGEKAALARQAMPNPGKTFLFGLRYQIASELAFYAPGQPQTVSINRWKRPNVYDYWWTDTDLIGWDAVGATDRPDSHTTMLDQVFARVDPPVRLDIHRAGGPGTREPIQTFWIYRAYGFTGGLRWQPPNRRDIRAY